MITHELMVSDLRDTGGHIMKILQIEDFGVPYTPGGIVINPDDLGMDRIDFMNFPFGTAYKPDPNGPTMIVSQQTATRYHDDAAGTDYWKIAIFIPNSETGVFEELPEGTPLTFPPELRPTFMITGA